MTKNQIDMLEKVARLGLSEMDRAIESLEDQAKCLGTHQGLIALTERRNSMKEALGAFLSDPPPAERR